jgi:hypothetical protein
MAELTILMISIAAFLLSALLAQQAHTALLPYLPPQFTDKKWLAHEEYTFKCSTPLPIQLKVVCSNVLFCIAATGFSCAGLIRWQDSSAHDQAGYMLMGVIAAFTLFRSICSIRAYRHNLLLMKHEN